MGILIFFIIHWYSSLFFQSFFHHRYAAHNICTMSKGWEKFFFIGCFITQGSSYISARTYGMMHRLHHAHTDKETDPHSPHNSESLLKMMVDTRNNYIAMHLGKIPVPDKYKKDLPDWPAFDKLVHNWIARTIWGLIYLGIYCLLATHWWQFLFLPLTLSMGSLQGVAINWWAHKFGYESYKMENTSKNILPVDIIFWGEAYHNNHHYRPGRANNAVKWFEVDFLYLAMRGMHALHIIRLKTPSNAPDARLRSQQSAIAAVKENYQRKEISELV